MSMYVCEFQRVSDCTYFGRSTHPDRDAAETHAVTELTRLGVEPQDALETAAAAGYVCTDARSGGYGVRIFEDS